MIANEFSSQPLQAFIRLNVNIYNMLLASLGNTLGDNAIEISFILSVIVLYKLRHMSNVARLTFSRLLE